MTTPTVTPTVTPSVPPVPPNTPAPVTPTQSPEELAAKLKDAIESRDAAKAKMREQESRLAALEAAEAKRARELEDAKSKSEQDRLVAQGEYEKALKLTEEKYSKEISNLKSSFQKTHLPMMIKNIASGIERITPQALADLPSILSPFVRLDPESFQPVVVDENGQQLKDEQLKPVNAVDFVKKFVNDRPYMLLDGLPPGMRKSGNDLNKGGGDMKDAVSNPKLAKEWYERDPEGYEAAKKEYFSPEAIRSRLAAKQK